MLNDSLEPVKLYCLFGDGDGLLMSFRADFPGFKKSIEEVVSSSFDGLLLMEDLALVEIEALRTDFSLSALLK
jgi:hypothetical protein